MIVVVTIRVRWKAPYWMPRAQDLILQPETRPSTEPVPVPRMMPTDPTVEAPGPTRVQPSMCAPYLLGFPTPSTEIPEAVNDTSQPEMLISVEAGPPVTTTPLRKAAPECNPNVQSSTRMRVETPVHTMPCDPATVEAKWMPRKVMPVRPAKVKMSSGELPTSNTASPSPTNWR